MLNAMLSVVYDVLCIVYYYITILVIVYITYTMYIYTEREREHQYRKRLIFVLIIILEKVLPCSLVCSELAIENKLALSLQSPCLALLHLALQNEYYHACLLVNFDHSYCISIFSYFYDQISDKQLLKKNHFSHIMIIAVILTYTLKNAVHHFRERKAHYIITLQPQPEDECCCSAHFLLFVRPGAPAQGCPHSS